MDHKNKEEIVTSDDLEPSVRVRSCGVLVSLLGLIPFLALVSYDWRDVSILCQPTLSPPSNLCGVFGAWFAFLLYSVLGLAAWLVPVVMVAVGVLMISGHVRRLAVRIVWMLVATLSICSLLQLGSESLMVALEKINLKPNAGGAVGYALMTCALERALNGFGGGALATILLLLSFVFIVGLREWIALISWIVDRRGGGRLEDAGGLRLSQPAPETQGLTDRERARFEKEQQREAERQRREEEKAEKVRLKEEEKARREAEKAEKQRQKEEERARREAEKAQKRAEYEREKAESQQHLEMMERAQRLRAKQEAARLALQAMKSASQPPAPPVSEPFATAVEAPAPQEPVFEPPKAEDASSGEEEKTECAAEDQEYPFPPLSLLDPIPNVTAEHGDLEATGARLVETLHQFDIDAEVVGMRSGPTVTQYELRPGPSVRVERIKNLVGNIQLQLAAKSIRIEAPIPGKSAVGIEVPNLKTLPVTFHELMESETWKNACAKMALPMALGKDVAGNVLVADLAKAPHLLVAGSTGSGKSVCLNSIITSFLMCRAQTDLRLFLVDPKRVEFAVYNGLPQLFEHVINDSKDVASILRRAIRVMEDRYKLLQRHKCRNIAAYNSRSTAVQGDFFGGESPDNDPPKLPYIVIIVDEVADIMTEVGKEIEVPISRLCAKSRAVGIHLILATQRPSVDVITGTIKSNIPGRIAFKVSQGNDSRTILDAPGAEDLLGKGDMLYLREGGVLQRAQGAFLDDAEIERVVEYIKERAAPCEFKEFASVVDVEAEEENDDEESEAPAETKGPTSSAAPGALEEDLRKALEIIDMTGRASVSMLQRRLGYGFNRASRIMETLEERGVLGPARGAQPREILVDIKTLLAPRAEDVDLSADAATAGEATSDAVALDSETMVGEEIPASAIPPPDAGA